MERSPQRKSRKRPIVLIVDDQDEILALCALALCARGFDVVPARDREDACHRAQRIRPDVVVTEISRSQPDDWCFVQDLKQHAQTRDIPVVVITERAERDVRDRAEREGCAVLVVKPYRPELLAGIIRDLLNRTEVHERATFERKWA